MEGVNHRTLLVAVVALGGCRALLGLEEGVVASGDALADASALADATDDAPSDTPIDAPAWWDPAFGSRRSITFDTSALLLPVMDLPVLVRIPTAVVAELRPNGVDIRFVADDQATVLPFEVEPNNGGALLCWVKLSLVSAGQRIWLYYDDPVATSQSNGAAVFTDYESVHHLATTADASGNNHTTDAPGPSTPASVDAVIGRGLDFDGATDFLTVNNGNGPYDFTTQMSVSVWIRTNVLDIPYQAIVTKGDTSWRLQRDNNSNLVTFATGAGSNADNVVTSSPVNDNVWHHILATQDASTKAIYIDGVLQESRANPPLIPANNNNVRVSSNEAISGRPWNGHIDELRISATARDAASARAEYVMVTSASFTTFGPRELSP